MPSTLNLFQQLESVLWDTLYNTELQGYQKWIVQNILDCMFEFCDTTHGSRWWPETKLHPWHQRHYDVTSCDTPAPRAALIPYHWLVPVSGWSLYPHQLGVLWSQWLYGRWHHWHLTVIRMVKMKVVLTVVLVVTRLTNMSRVLNTPVALDNASCTRKWKNSFKI